MPAVTRVGDADVTHCSTPYRAQGSPNVFCNSIAVSRQGDLNTTHKEQSKKKGKRCSDHAASITTGSSTVFVNGRGIGRVGDAISGCTSVAQGSPNVFAGG